MRVQMSNLLSAWIDNGSKEWLDNGGGAQTSAFLVEERKSKPFMYREEMSIDPGGAYFQSSISNPAIFYLDAARRTQAQ